MKFWSVFVITLIAAGCAGGPQVNTDVNIPILAEGEVGVDQSYANGWKQLESGDPAQAMEMFRRSRADEDRLYVAFGFVYLVKGKADLAFKNFNNALKLNPESAPARLGMAAYHEARGEMVDAFRIYSRLRAEFPENPWVRLRHERISSRETERWLHEADRLQRLGKMDEGYLEALENALKFSPELMAVKERIAAYYSERNRDEQAAGVYEEIVRNAPSNLDAMKKLGEIYEEQGQYDRALVVYRGLLLKNPGSLDVSNRINGLKVRFNEQNLPLRLKNIYFKSDLNREELAALIGRYYSEELVLSGSPMIITDIQHSFARDAIVKLCSLGIMSLRPDHTFGVGRMEELNVTRARFALVVRNLIRYLEGRGFTLDLQVSERNLEAADVFPVHKEHDVIRFMVNAKLMQLDEYGNFRPAEDISPFEALRTFFEIRRRMNPLEG